MGFASTMSARREPLSGGIQAGLNEHECFILSSAPELLLSATHNTASEREPSKKMYWSNTSVRLSLH
jgi:hypothetical protein